MHLCPAAEIPHLIILIILIILILTITSSVSFSRWFFSLLSVDLLAHIHARRAYVQLVEDDGNTSNHHFRHHHRHHHHHHHHHPLSLFALLVVGRSADIQARRAYVQLVEDVRATNGKVFLLSTLHVAGERMNEHTREEEIGMEGGGDA